MSSKLKCPSCGENSAKISSSYPDILVCYCGGPELNEVGTVDSLNEDPLESKILYEGISIGDFVSPINKPDLIFMVLEQFDVSGWNTRGLLLKFMSNKDTDLSTTKNNCLIIGQECKHKKITLNQNQSSTISNKDFKFHRSYFNLLNEDKNVSSYIGDVVGVKNSRWYGIDSGIYIGAFSGLPKAPLSPRNTGTLAVVKSFFFDKNSGRPKVRFVWSEDLD